MPTIPDPAVDYGALYDLAQAPMRHRALMAAVELGLFEQLAEPRPPEAVSKALTCDADNLELLLDALVACGLLIKESGCYRNTLVADLFLVPGKDTYFGNWLRVWQGFSMPQVDIAELVRLGGSALPMGSSVDDQEMWARIAESNAAWIFGGVGQQMVRELQSLPEYARFRHMLDLGGGSGAFAITLADRNPKLRGRVLDLPAVTRVAQRNIDRHELGERVTTLAANYLKDDIGADYDLVWACGTLNFARQALVEVLAKVLSSLNPGGVFASFHDGIAADRADEDPLAISHLMMLMSAGRAFLFEPGEIAKAMAAAGFTDIESRRIRTPVGVMALDIGRKPVADASGAGSIQQG